MFCHCRSNSDHDLSKPYQNVFNGANGKAGASEDSFDAGYTAQLRRLSKHQYVRSASDASNKSPNQYPPTRSNSQLSPHAHQYHSHNATPTSGQSSHNNTPSSGQSPHNATPTSGQSTHSAGIFPYPHNSLSTSVLTENYLPKNNPRLGLHINSNDSSAGQQVGDKVTR